MKCFVMWQNRDERERERGSGKLKKRRPPVISALSAHCISTGNLSVCARGVLTDETEVLLSLPEAPGSQREQRENVGLLHSDVISCFWKPT